MAAAGWQWRHADRVQDRPGLATTQGLLPEGHGRGMRPRTLSSFQAAPIIAPATVPSPTKASCPCPCPHDVLWALVSSGHAARGIWHKQAISLTPLLWQVQHHLPAAAPNATCSSLMHVVANEVCPWPAPSTGAGPYNGFRLGPPLSQPSHSALRAGRLRQAPFALGAAQSNEQARLA